MEASDSQFLLHNMLFLSCLPLLPHPHQPSPQHLNRLLLLPLLQLFPYKAVEENFTAVHHKLPLIVFSHPGHKPFDEDGVCQRSYFFTQQVRGPRLFPLPPRLDLKRLFDPDLIEVLRSVVLPPVEALLKCFEIGPSLELDTEHIPCSLPAQVELEGFEGFILELVDLFRGDDVDAESSDHVLLPVCLEGFEDQSLQFRVVLLRGTFEELGKSWGYFKGPDQLLTSVINHPVACSLLTGSNSQKSQKLLLGMRHTFLPPPFHPLTCQSQGEVVKEHPLQKSFQLVPDVIDEDLLLEALPLGVWLLLLQVSASEHHLLLNLGLLGPILLLVHESSHCLQSSDSLNLSLLLMN